MGARGGWGSSSPTPVVMSGPPVMRETEVVATYDVDELNHGQAKLDRHCLREVLNWTNKRVVTFLLEQRLNQTNFVVASQTSHTQTHVSLLLTHLLTYLSVQICVTMMPSRQGIRLTVRAELPSCQYRPKDASRLCCWNTKSSCKMSMFYLISK